MTVCEYVILLVLGNNLGQKNQGIDDNANYFWLK